jgi:GTP-binding protein HflX
VASFHATLAEVCAADLLLHVVDASVAQPERQIAAVESVLVEIGASRIPSILVLNKADLLEDRGRAGLLSAGRATSAVVSAATGEGVKELEAIVSRCLDERRVEVELFVPEDRSSVMSTLGRVSEIVDASVADGGIRVIAILEPKHLASLERAGATIRSRVDAADRNGKEETDGGA